MDALCPKCGGPTSPGVASALGLIGAVMAPADEPRLVFVVPGTPTSLNPIKAFGQGLSDERSDQAYLLHGRRCTRCGFVELYATERTTPSGA